MRIVIGYLRSSQTDDLPNLADIQPAEWSNSLIGISQSDESQIPTL